MRPRRLGVERLESRIVLNGLGLGSGAPDPDWVSVIVTLHERPDAPRAVAEGILNRFGGRLGHVYEHALNGFSAQLPSAAIAALKNNPQIQAVETDMQLHTTAQTEPTGVRRIGGIGIGTGGEIAVDIAIIDSGIQRNHPDLYVVDGVRFYTVTTGPLWGRGTFADSNYDDDNGHGTHVAGTAAARNNDGGVVGVAPGARLHAVKVLGSNGSGNMSDIIAGVNWVTARASTIAVANMSLGGTGWSPALYTAIQNSVAAGVVYVVAAGNNGVDIHGSDKTFGTSDDFIPAAYPQVATISAFVDTDGKAGGQGSQWYWSRGSRWLADDTFADFSNFSNSDEAKNQHFVDANIAILGQDRHNLGLGIDLVMPGVDIDSTYLNNGTARMTGTSMAAPHAAGLAALHIAANGRATDAAGVYAIRQALIDMGNPWRSPLGLMSPAGSNSDSPDKYEENVGWVNVLVAERLPEVTITEPVDGAVLRDVTAVPLTATAIAFQGRTISQVEFFVDGVSIGSDTDAEDGWSAIWDTELDTEDENGSGIPLFPDGTYTITAVVTDSEGKIGSNSIQIQLDNVDDPPTVAITTPAAGVVSGTVVITAEATDDRGVAGVEFFVGTDSEGETTVTPIGADTDGSDGWSVEWNPADGSYEIWAVAWDGENVTESAAVSVTVIQNSVTTMTASLEGSAAPVNRNFWQASVTVTVVDTQNTALSGATVYGQWSTADSPVTGSTSASGDVTFNSGNLRTNVNSITFSLTDVAITDYEYEQGVISIIVYQDGSSALIAARQDDRPIFGQVSLTSTATVAGPSALANSLANRTDTAALTVPEASLAANDDAFRVSNPAAHSTEPRSVSPPHAAAASSRLALDDLPAADSGAWSLYASAVDELLAIGW